MSQINIVGNKAWADGSSYLFQFGICPTWVLVYSNDSLQDALEEAASWLADNAPGVFTEPDYQDAVRDIFGVKVTARSARNRDHAGKFNGPWPLFENTKDLDTFLNSEGLYCMWNEQETVPNRTMESLTEEELEEVRVQAEADLHYTESGYLSSDEWYVEDNPTKERLLAIAHDNCYHATGLKFTGLLEHSGHEAKVRRYHEFKLNHLTISNDNIKCKNAGSYGAEAKPGDLVVYGKDRQVGRYLGKIVRRAYSTEPQILVISLSTNLSSAYYRTPLAEEVTQVSPWPINMLAWLARKELPDMDLLTSMEREGSLRDSHIIGTEDRAKERVLRSLNPGFFVS